MKVEQIAEICNPNPPPSNHVRVTKCEFDRTLKDEPIFTGGKAENFFKPLSILNINHAV